MILVFKTNLRDKDKKKIVQLLSCLDEIKQINFDLEDCDNILRIESETNIASKIENLLLINNFYCLELE